MKDNETPKELEITIPPAEAIEASSESILVTSPRSEEKKSRRSYSSRESSSRSISSKKSSSRSRRPSSSSRRKRSESPSSRSSSRRRREKKTSSSSRSRNDREGDDARAKSRSSSERGGDNTRSSSSRSLNKRSSSSGSLNDRERDDARAKNRARSRGGVATRPGVHHETDSRPRSGNGTRKRRDDDEKAKYRARSSSGGATRPGVHHETNSRSSRQIAKGSGHKSDARIKDRARSRNTVVLPGAHAETDIGSAQGRREREKAKQRARPERLNSNQDLRSQKEARKMARSGATNRSSSEPSITVDETPTAVPLQGELIEEPQESMVKLKQQHQDDVERAVNERMEEMQRRQQEEQDEQDADRRRKKRRCAVTILVVSLLAIIGGVAAFFALRPGTTAQTLSTGDASDETQKKDDFASDSPSFQSSVAPSSPPSTFYEFPPPDFEACQRLQNGDPPQDETIAREFEIDFDFGLSSTDQDMATEVANLEQKVVDWLAKPLVGCDRVQRRLDSDIDAVSSTAIQGRREMRQLQLEENKNPLQFLVAGIDDVRVIDQEEPCLPPYDSANCRFMKLMMTLLIKGDTANFNVQYLLSGFVPPGENLKEDMGLSDSVSIFMAREGGIRGTGPTNQPSRTPSLAPSLASSGSPTILGSSTPTVLVPEPTIAPVALVPVPTLAPSANPTALVPEPTTTPSANPTRKPSATPSQAPTPTPPPTLPDATPSPTVTASSGPSKYPSVEPSRMPSLAPSKSPSSGPSSAPTISASQVPSLALSSQPSKTPTQIPTSNPTGSPSDNPTACVPAWTQLGSTITGPNKFGHDAFISLDGSTVAGGSLYASSSRGLVRVYSIQGSNLVKKGQDIYGDAGGDLGGRMSLSSDGSRLLISAVYNDGNGYRSGQLRIYDFDGTNWVQVGQSLYGDNANDGSGGMISSDGSTVFQWGRGYFRRYVLESGNWVQQGPTLLFSDLYFRACSQDGLKVAIGNWENSNEAGVVRIYAYDGNGYVQFGNELYGESAGDQVGGGVTFSDGSTVIGIKKAWNTEVNKLKLYDFDGTSWVKLGQDIDPKSVVAGANGLGVAISADGTRVAAGSSQYNSGNGNVRVYDYDADSDTWKKNMDLNGPRGGGNFGWTTRFSSDKSKLLVSSLTGKKIQVFEDACLA